MGVLRVLQAGAWKDVYPSFSNPTPGNVYANAAARDAALPSATEGMECWLLDIHQKQVFRDNKWFPMGGALPFGQFRMLGGSIPANAWVAYSGNASLTYGRGGLWSYSNGIVTIPVAGLYLFNFSSVVYPSTAGFRFGISIAQPPGTNPLLPGAQYASANDVTSIAASWAYDVDAGTQVMVTVRSSSPVTVGDGELQCIYQSAW